MNKSWQRPSEWLISTVLILVCAWVSSEAQEQVQVVAGHNAV